MGQVFVLIMIIRAFSGGIHGVSVTTVVHEFSSQKACEDAYVSMRSFDKRNIEGGCFPK